MEELKNCPFCNMNAMSHTEPTRSVVGCFYAKCGVNPSLSATTMVRASELWNKRTNDRLVEENAELREAFAKLKVMAIQEREFRLEDCEEISAPEMRESLEMFGATIDNLLNK